MPVKLVIKYLDQNMPENHSDTDSDGLENTVDSDQATEYHSADSVTQHQPEPPSSDSDLPSDYYDSDEELRREKEMIKKYLKENPFTLTYEELGEKMEQASRDHPEFAHNIMVWSAELGEWNFEMLKVIRENIWDLEKTKEIGELIHQRGGHQALTGNFYILKNWFCSEPPLRWQCTDIIFDGVGDWKH